MICARHAPEGDGQASLIAVVQHNGHPVLPGEPEKGVRYVSESQCVGEVAAPVVEERRGRLGAD